MKLSGTDGTGFALRSQARSKMRGCGPAVETLELAPDEVFVRINGERHYLWRAVDHEGEVLKSLVTKKRDKKAVLKIMKKALSRYGSPNEIVTDRLRSYHPICRIYTFSPMDRLILFLSHLGSVVQ
tara:strand:- start:855 stop:1232 length:378 start_codon:yes stop_codon:yes gene_type:complete